jgi:hypothetical protein
MRQLKNPNYRLDLFWLLSAVLCLTIGCTERNVESIGQEPIQIKLITEDSIQLVKNKNYKLTEYSILVTNKSSFGMHYYNFYRDYYWPDNTNLNLIYFVVDEDGKKYPHCGFPSSTPAIFPKKSKVIEIEESENIYLAVVRLGDEKISSVFKKRFCIKSNKRIFLQAFYIHLVNGNHAYEHVKNGNYKILARSNLIPIQD